MRSDFNKCEYADDANSSLDTLAQMIVFTYFLILTQLVPNSRLATTYYFKTTCLSNIAKKKHFSPIPIS